MKNPFTHTIESTLRESLDYIAIARGNARPTKLDSILQRRMDDFIEKRMQAIRTTTFEF